MSESPVAVLTGGAQGLGAAMCIALLDKEYRVCVADIQEQKGNDFVKQQQEKFGKENVKFIVCDVTKEDDYKGIFEFALKEFNKIDLVIDNAGVILEDDPRKTLDINLMGPIIGCQLALQYMGKRNGGKGGMVINTASILGFLPYHALPAYTASKHGVIGLTRSYGVPYHLERDGVFFTAICPSFTDTEILHKCRTNSLVPGFDPYKEHDVMEPEYVAQGILKLLEDKINGSTLVVTKKGYKYIGYQEDFKGIPIV